MEQAQRPRRHAHPVRAKEIAAPRRKDDQSRDARLGQFGVIAQLRDEFLQHGPPAQEQSFKVSEFQKVVTIKLDDILHAHWNFALQRQHWYRAIRSMSSENAKRQRVSPLTMLHQNAVDGNRRWQSRPAT